MIMAQKTRLKKSPEELREYLAFKRRGYFVPHKKGKGSFKRNKKVNIDE